jgi:hypothetical protein
MPQEGSQTMTVSRRDLLRAAAIGPAAFVVARVASSAGRIVTASAPTLRPPASGTSASRCARCGDPGHTMLDAGCPLAGKVA